MNTDESLPSSDAERAAETVTPPDAVDMASAPAPRTRWAAIIWGSAFAVLAWTGIWMLSGADRRSVLTDWFASLTPGTITASVLLTIGALVLITGVVGLIRRVQRGGITG